MVYSLHYLLQENSWSEPLDYDMNDIDIDVCASSLGSYSCRYSLVKPLEILDTTEK